MAGATLQPRSRRATPTRSTPTTSTSCASPTVACALLKIFAPALPETFAGTWNARLRDNANRFGDARATSTSSHAELLELVSPEGLADATSMTALLETVRQARAARHHAGISLDLPTQGRLLLEFYPPRCTACVPTVFAEPPTCAALPACAWTGCASAPAAAPRPRPAWSPPACTHCGSTSNCCATASSSSRRCSPRRIARYLNGLVRADRARLPSGRRHALQRPDGWSRAARAHRGRFVLGWHALRYARLRRRCATRVRTAAVGGKAMGKRQPTAGRKDGPRSSCRNRANR